MRFYRKSSYTLLIVFLPMYVQVTEAWTPIRVSSDGLHGGGISASIPRYTVLVDALNCQIAVLEANTEYL